MEKILISEFSEISYSAQRRVVILKWLPENRRMSEFEFRLQIDTVFSTAEVFKARIIYIDAFDFNYPVSANTINIIKDFLSKCVVEIFAMVESEHLLGKMGLLRLIKMLENSSTNLILFKLRTEGDYWYSKISNKKNL